MGLADFFRPKWKHSDPEVRAEAVRTMGDDDLQRLATIAREDDDDNVRRLAIRRITDVEALEELAAAQLGGGLSAFAAERASSLWLATTIGDDAGEARRALERIADDATLGEVVKRSPHDEIRSAALQRIEDAKVLADIARSAKDGEVRVAAVGAITDEATLKSLAISGEHREVASSALARLEEPENLKQVAKQAKIKALRSKAERRFRKLTKPAKKKKQEGPTDAERAEHRRARLLKVLSEAEQLHPSVDDDAEQVVADLKRRFEKLAASVPDDVADLRVRLDAACDEYLSEHGVIAAKVESEARIKAKLSADAEAREALCREAEALGETEPLEVAAALRERWEALGAIVEGQPTDWQARFDAALAQHESAHKAWSGRREARGDFEKLLAAGATAVELESLDDARKELKKVRLDWRQLEDEVGVDRDLAKQFDELHDRLRARQDEAKAERRKEQDANLERVEAIIAKVESYVGQEDLRGVEGALRDARKVLKKPGPLPSRKHFTALRDRFRQADRKLSKALREKRDAEDWERLFNVPKLEELIAKAKALKEEEDLAEIAKSLRELQAEWKKAGPAPRSRNDELWTAFKSACDAAYERCEPYFAQRKEDRASNLAKKVAICEEAEALAQSTEWKETADRLKALLAEWKKIGPVDRKDSDAVWKRFRAACDTFFDARKEAFKQLDAERQENLTIKRGLCEKAEELAESSEWRETAERLKDLQLEWKGIGPVPRKHSDEIWKRFRAACDRFFARRAAHLDGGRRDNLAKKLELCAELERAVPAPSPSARPAIEPAPPAGPVETPAPLTDPVLDTDFLDDEPWEGLTSDVPPPPKEPTEPVEPADDDGAVTPGELEALPDEQAPAHEASGEAKPEAGDAVEAEPKAAEAAEAKPEAAEAKPEAAEAAPKAAEAAPEAAEAADAKPEAADAKPEAAEAGAAEQPSAERLVEIWKEWQELGPIPFDEVEAVESRFAKAMSGAIARAAEALDGTELDPKTLLARRQKIVDALAALAPEEPETEEKQAEADGETSIAEQLHRAMARNAFKRETETSEKTRIEESARGLLRSWRRLPPLAGPEAEALDKAFAEAYRQVVGEPVPPREEGRPPRRGKQGGRRRSPRRRPREDARADAGKDETS